MPEPRLDFYLESRTYTTCCKGYFKNNSHNLKKNVDIK